MAELDIYAYAETEDLTEFLEGLDSTTRARFHAKLDSLRQNGFVLLGSSVLTDTKLPHIKEIRVNGRVAVRVLCCRGPIDGRKELTLLFGAFERDNKYAPKDALEIAEGRRVRVAAAPNLRRAKYERKGRTAGDAPNGRQ